MHPFRFSIASSMSSSLVPATTRLCESWATVEAIASRFRPKTTDDASTDAAGLVLALAHNYLQLVILRIRNKKSVFRLHIPCVFLCNDASRHNADNPKLFGLPRVESASRLLLLSLNEAMIVQLAGQQHGHFSAHPNSARARL